MLLLYPFAALRLWRNQQIRPLIRWSAALLGASLIFYAKWWDWSGDDAWGPRFLIPAVMAALVVVAAIDLSRPALHRTFVALAIAGFLIQLPPLLLGPHTSLMLDHLRQPAATRGSISHTLKEIRWNPADSQITDTFELLLLKLAPARWLTGATWLASFDPPLRPADIPWDVFWIHRPGHSPGTAMPVGYAARPAAR